jgi:hypothetical protein
MTSENPKQEKAESKTRKRTAEQHGNEPKQQVTPTSGATKTNPPQAQNGDKIPCKKHRDWHDNAMLVVDAVGVLFLIGYTTFAALQWSAMNKTLGQATRQADIANQQLRSERAYFVLIKYDTVPMYSAEGNKGRLLRYRITVTYENLGNTPATDAEMILDLVPVKRVGNLGSPEHPIALDIPDWEHRNGPRIPASVAPHGIVVGTVEVSIEQAIQVSRGEIYLILWTKAQYRDVFDRTAIRHSGTCVELIPYANLESGAPFQFKLASRQHNYAD